MNPPALATPPGALIFDLDGTLVDSLRDIAESVNACLELLGLPPRDLDGYRYMVGEGLESLCQRVLEKSQLNYLKRLIDLTRAYYRLRCLRYTRPYEGIPDVLERLAQAGIPLAVLSNKPHDMTLRIVEALWPGGPFRVVRGSLDPGLRKPDPRIARAILDELGVPAAKAWLIGDTPVDVKTAVNVGASAVGVAWGFRNPAELAAAGAAWVIAEPGDLLRLPGLQAIMAGSATRQK